MKKYELTSESKIVFGKTLYRIRALVAFGNVTVGELGGWIEKESNLSQEGSAWVTDSACVSGSARVSGSAWVTDSACVSGSARVSGSAWVTGSACVSGSARVTGSACVTGSAQIEKTTHYIVIGAIGSRNDSTTFFRTKDKKIFVSCGCFYGDIEEFVKAVKATHGGTKHEKTYLAAVELAKLQIEDV